MPIDVDNKTRSKCDLSTQLAIILSILLEVCFMAKVTPSQLNEMFREGRLIARAIEIYTFEENPASNAKWENDQLFSKKLDGIHANVERHGLRGRSATLLVEGINMSLYHNVGFLYDADKTSIKSYMFYDSGTVSSNLNTNCFFNVNIDKKKFEPILSRQDFLKKYRAFMEKVDNFDLRDDRNDYTKAEDYRYNEVLCNFFPESLIGLIGRDTDPVTLLNLLILRHHKRIEDNQDLPMAIMNNGRSCIWQPTVNDIITLLNVSKENIKELASNDTLITLAKNIGFTLIINNFDDIITPLNLIINNDFDFKASELMKCLSSMAGISKGDSSCGIKVRLLNIINKKLLDEGSEPVRHLSNTFIKETDIKNLISLLGKELQNSTKHPIITGLTLSEYCNRIIKEIRNKRECVSDCFTSPNSYA